MHASRRVLVTGVAGFIGFHLARRLRGSGVEVVGIDNLNDSYEVRLKEARLALLAARDGFRFHRLGLGDREGVAGLFREARPEPVVHLTRHQKILGAQDGYGKHTGDTNCPSLDAQVDELVRAAEGGAPEEV